MKDADFEIQIDTRGLHLGFQSAYQATLVAPLDDMWAAFADAAQPYALLIDDELVGCCKVNEERELYSFHMRVEVEDRAEAFFSYLIEALELVAAFPSTVDPSFLSLSLSAGHGAVAKALMFQHFLEPEGEDLSGLRRATAADSTAALAFMEAALGAPQDFLGSYIAARIEQADLFLYEQGDEILASGECRRDQRQPGFAHLGVIVARSQRGKGLGSRLLNALVGVCQGQKVTPLCSTEPENLAARAMIHRAGFRARHRVFRVALGA